MITLYFTPTGEAEIRATAVKKQTEFMVVDSTGRTMRKESQRGVYHATWQEARNHLYMRYIGEMIKARRALAAAKENIKHTREITL